MFESGAGKLGDSSAVTGRVPTKRRVNRDDSSDEDEPDVVVIDVEAEGTTPGAVGVDAPVSSQLEPVVRNGEIQSAAAQQSSCNSTISGDSRSEEDVWLDDKLGMVKPTVLVVAPAHSTFHNASKPAFEPTAAPPVRGPTVPVVASRDRDVQFADLSQEPEIQSAAPTLDRVSPASVRTDSEPGAREDAQAVQTMDTAKSNRQSPKPDAAVISAVVPTPPATVQPVGVKQPSPPPMQPSPLIDTSAMPIIRPVTPMGPPPGPPMKRPRVIRLMRPSDSTQATCPSPTGTGGSADSREREPQIFSIV